jgi:hypothetical protein
MMTRFHRRINKLKKISSDSYGMSVSKKHETCDVSRCFFVRMSILRQTVPMKRYLYMVSLFLSNKPIKDHTPQKLGREQKNISNPIISNIILG